MISRATGKHLKRRTPPPIPRSAKRPDWKWIRAEWEADLKSDRQIAAQSTAAGQKVSHVAIGKRARTEGWKKKPVSVEVRREIERRLAAAAVPDVAEVSGAHASPDVILESAALQGVEVIRQHRSALDRGRRLTEALLGQLEEATAKSEDMARLVAEDDEAVKAAAPEGETLAQRRARLMRSIGLASRASILKDLSAAARNWIGLERIAFNLNDRDQVAPDSIEARLAKLEAEEE